MNDHDEELAQLFARSECIEPSDEFLIGLQLRLRRERAFTRLQLIGSSLTAVGALATAIVLIPPTSIPPVRYTLELLSTSTGFVISALCAAALVTWLHLEA